MTIHMNPFLDFFVDAVEKQIPIRFSYQDHARFVCPFLLGKTAEGKLVLHAFQFAGSSSQGTVASPEQGQWRFFYLDQIHSNVDADETADRPWYPANLAKREDEYTPPKFIREVVAIHKEQP